MADEDVDGSVCVATVVTSTLLFLIHL